MGAPRQTREVKFNYTNKTALCWLLTPQPGTGLEQASHLGASGRCFPGTGKRLRLGLCGPLLYRDLLQRTPFFLPAPPPSMSPSCPLLRFIAQPQRSPLCGSSPAASQRCGEAWYQCRSVPILPPSIHATWRGWAAWAHRGVPSGC